MSSYARTRADVDVRSEAKTGASVLERYATDCLVEILEEQTGWYKIKPVRLKSASAGYVPGLALVFPSQAQAVFPALVSSAGVALGDSVPGAIKLSDFQAWQAAGGKPAWITEVVWDSIGAERQAALPEEMLASIRADQAAWEAWVQELATNARTAEAVMEEWIVQVQGGRELYAIRDHYVYKQPMANNLYYGCALKSQVVRWTGKVQTSTADEVTRTFYEVKFYRMSLEMCGWFRADLLAEYVYPGDETDAQVDANAKTVFDLSTPLVRFPADEEIAAAKAAGYTGAQYIDIARATGKTLRHYCLCGEFCVSTLAGQDVIPTLSAWLASGYWRVAAILKDAHEGTSIADLQSLLAVVGLQGELYSSMPTAPQYIKARLAQGQFTISGCGINSAGKVKADGKIRHWVIVEDVLPVGNSGWVRIYNPFNNQEEVYNYDLFMTSAGTGAGLWVTPLTAA